MLSDTLKKFGYPYSLIKEYKNWVLLCRQRQVTLGSMVLICKDETGSFSQISEKSFAELHDVVKDVETKIKTVLEYDKINYEMLMMVDPVVHFHIFPRYSGAKNFYGTVFYDHNWPQPPDLRKVNDIDGAIFDKIVHVLRTAVSPKKR